MYRRTPAFKVSARRSYSDLKPGPEYTSGNGSVTFSGGKTLLNLAFNADQALLLYRERFSDIGEQQSLVEARDLIENLSGL